MKNFLKKPEWIVSLLAFGIRFWFLQRFIDSPFFEPIANGNDRALYDGLAQKIAHGHLMPAGVFEYMPLYPWILGCIYWILGPNLYAVGILGSLIDAVTAWIMVRFARQQGASLWAVLVAGCFYAFYPTAIAYSVVTMPNTLNAFLLTLFIVLASKLFDGTTNKISQKKRIFLLKDLQWLGVGLLAGVIALGFAGMLLIAMGCLVFWLVVQIRYACLRPLSFVCFIMGLSLPIIPITFHNWHAEKEFVLVTAHGGFNFFMGNNPDATGYPIQIGGFRGDAGSLLVDARAEAERLEGKKLSAAQFSRHWSNRAWNFICDHPFAEIKLFIVKFLKFWNRMDYDDMRLLPMYRLTGLAFTSSFWPGFGWISWIGLYGLILARRCGLLKAITLSGLCGILAFFITARYRLTLAPALVILGAIGLGSHRQSLVRTSCAALFAAILVLYPLRQTDFRALDHYNTAAYLMACKNPKPEFALQQAQRGLQIAPAEANLFFVKGNALFALHKKNEAIEAYQNAIMLKPSFASAHYNLAQTWMTLNDSQKAEEEASLALKYDPQHAGAAKLIIEIQAKK